MVKDKNGQEHVIEGELEAALLEVAREQIRNDMPSGQIIPTQMEVHIRKVCYDSHECKPVSIPA